MASKTMLNAKNHEALGAPWLAELLLELSGGAGPRLKRIHS